MVAEALGRQTFQEFEWLIGAPDKLDVQIYNAVDDLYPYDFVIEPPKRNGDYYNLNKAWNALFRKAKGKLIVNIVDGITFRPDTLEKLWRHYEADPKACISCIGHQYTDFDSVPVWIDPRARLDFGTFYEVKHTEMECCLASFPKQAVLDVGGIDEEWDKYAALGEKEMMARFYKAGYKLFISQDITYKAIKHDRLSSEWDEKFNAGIAFYNQCMKEISQDTRLKLKFLK